MTTIRKLFRRFSDESRRRRGLIFRDSFRILPETRILDVGSEDGSAIATLLEGTLASPENVWIADIDRTMLLAGRRRYGFRAVELGEFGPLPFEDKSFDIVYCSSAIEHVTIAKSDVWNVQSGKIFNERAARSQKFFAAEISRVGRGYFVQTPNRGFPLESHTWLPLMGLLPRPILIAAMRAANRVWVKKSIPDFRLLNSGEMQKLFPDARIELEKKFGFTKSIMAIKPN